MQRDPLRVQRVASSPPALVERVAQRCGSGMGSGSGAGGVSSTAAGLAT
jgi:hypothetical protein